MLYIIARENFGGANHVQITSDKNRAEDLADDDADIIAVDTLTPLDSEVWNHMMRNYVNFILPEVKS